MRWKLILALVLTGSVASAAPYTVKKGDTLYGIARANGVSLSRLLLLNKLAGGTLRPGQLLQLPGGGTVTAAPRTDRAAPAASAASSGRSSLVRTAYSKVGSAYVWGAIGPGAFDCSGFTRFVMHQYGVELPHSSRAQFLAGRPVSASSLIEGDLLFYNTGGSGISHVALYVGNGRMVHATNPSTGVVLSNFNESYYMRRFVGARRVLPY